MSTVFVLTVLLCSTCFVWVALALTDGLLPNGNFEQGPQLLQMKGTKVISHNSIPHWEISGLVEYVKSGQQQGYMRLLAPEGSYAVKLGNGASVKQKVNVAKGTDYSITFSVAHTCAQNQALVTSAAPNSGTGTFSVQTVYNFWWDDYAWSFKAMTDTQEIIIQNPSTNEDPSCGPILDSVAIKALNVPQANIAENLLTNGNFEQGPYFVHPNTSQGVLIPPNVPVDHSPLPGWTTKQASKAVRYIDFEHFSVPEGKHAVELVAGTECHLEQVAKTTPGKSYVLSFIVGDSGHSCVGSLAVQAFAGKESIKVPYESKGKGGSKPAQLKFTATDIETSINFSSSFYTLTKDSSLCGPVIDDVKLIESL